MAAALQHPSTGRDLGVSPSLSPRAHVMLLSTTGPHAISRSPLSRMTLSHDEEIRLLQRIAVGDERAFRRLVDEHLAGVHHFAVRLLGRREEAEEVAQDTFLRLWETAERFEPRARLRTWLYTVARHAAIDRLRKRRETFTDRIEEAPGSGGPGALLASKQDAEAVRAALAELAPRQRAAITLVHYQGLSGTEAAQAMGIGVEAVESLLSRARRKLRTILQKTQSSSCPPHISDRSHD